MREPVAVAAGPAIRSGKAPDLAFVTPNAKWEAIDRPAVTWTSTAPNTIYNTADSVLTG